MPVSECRVCKGDGVCVECDGMGTDPGFSDDDQYERNMKISPEYAREQDEEGAYSRPCCECEGDGKCVACGGTGRE